jgi:hypothetical protein
VAVRKDLFALTARRAEQENLQLTRIRIKFADHLQLETAALETGHREPPERAVCRRLGRGVILASLEKAGCSEFHHATLPRHVDICSPTCISAFRFQNFSFFFVLFSALKPRAAFMPAAYAGPWTMAVYAGEN